MEEPEPKKDEVIQVMVCYPNLGIGLRFLQKKHSVLVFHKSSAGVVLGCW